MAFAPALSLIVPLSPSSSSSPSSFPLRPSETSTHKLPLFRPKLSHSALSAASASPNQPSPPFTSEQDFLDAIAGFGDTENLLPVVRTYENDLARLTLVGAVESRQALTAAAADGGVTADEHLSAAMAAMVVETVFPGLADDRSTISTRLFLPTIRVKERAIKIRNSLGKDMLQGMSSKDILSMTFRQTVLQQLWSLELALFDPGTERNMHDLENPREVPVSLSLSSSDERVISEIGEVICAAVLDNTENNFLSSSGNRSVNRLSSWFKKSRHIASRNSSVILYNWVETDILANAKILYGKFKSERGKYKLEGSSELKKSWLASISFSELEKIGGPEFCAWISEYVPSYMLQIDGNILNNVKFEGWEKLEENRWGAVLTRSQMASLVDIVDMYYEDTFTLPEKRLPCYAVAKSSKLDLNKVSYCLQRFPTASNIATRYFGSPSDLRDSAIAIRGCTMCFYFVPLLLVIFNGLMMYSTLCFLFQGSSLLKTFSTFLASGILFVTICVVGKLCVPHLPSRMNFIQQSSHAQLCDTSCVPHQSLNPSELEECCISIIRRIKDSFGWSGEIMTKSGACAFIGELPKFLGDVDHTSFSMLDMSAASMPLVASEEEMKGLADIATYQVVVSVDRKIVGFQPTNRVAVNNWAANPLSEELYGGKKLSPGLLEPGLKMSRPSGMVVLELLISLKQSFAIVRAADISDA